ncbi:MAG: hypothetical protein KJ069_02305 [Anaerolineae bacterium]|nr:hypothetical protein [Anaerolineae bacterium]
MDSDTSFEERFWSWLGYRLVDENTLLPVIKHRCVIAFRKPGWHHIAGLGKKYGQPISTALRISPTIQIDTPTTDGITVSVFVNVKYTFDPRQIDSNMKSSIAKLGDDALSEIVYDQVGEAVRSVCGRKSEAQLANGSLWAELKRDIRHNLQRDLASYGIGFRSDKSVTILNIVPPVEIVRERVAAKSRTIYADSIQKQPPELAHELHEQEIVRHGDFVHISYDRTPPPRTNGLPITELYTAVPEFARNGRHKHPN